MGANVEGLAGMLGVLGFETQKVVDVSGAEMTKQIGHFIASMVQAPAGSINVVYYAGHGLQYNSNNYLLGVDLSPEASAENITTAALNVDEKWISQFPDRPDCLQVAIIDACRTNFTSIDESQPMGLNQVMAPPGSIVSFSTQAGKPAIAPADPKKLTFYTKALVDQLTEVKSYTTFSELLRLTKQRVFKEMQGHPLPIIRDLAQNPFIAENINVDIQFSIHQNNQLGDQTEMEVWREIERTEWPPALLKKLKQFLSLYPASKKAGLVSVFENGAKSALSVLRNPEIKLYKTSFSLPQDTKVGVQESDLSKAARGDKDAAARIAKAYSNSDHKKAKFRYEGWLQFATGLGNGIAAYELALYYRQKGLVQAASNAEARAIKLGYQPHRGLTSER